jgi:outer membrane immunogenic protein
MRSSHSPLPSQTAVGRTAGGGLEYAIDDHWIVRGEVRYTDFGNRNFNFGCGTDADYLKSRFNEVSTTLGVSYKF